MKRTATIVTFAFLVLLVMAFPAIGAELHGPHQGTSCGDGYVGMWHFVNNQTGGLEEPGYLVAWFGGTNYVTVEASKVNRNVQHFYVPDDSGKSGSTLVNAWSWTADEDPMPGRLVLSDYECREVKKP